MPPRAKKEPAKPVEPEFDPFSEPDQDDVPDGDEAQTELPPPWDVSDETDVNSTDTNEKKVVVVGNSEGKITSTFKGGTGFEKPWVVVHAEDIKEQISIINDPEFKELLTLVQQASEYFQGQAPTSNTQAAASSPQGGSQARSQGRPNSAGDGPLGPQHCKHGQKKFWSKFDEEKNEMVQIYFCPAPKGSSDKCKNQYVN